MLYIAKSMSGAEEWGRSLDNSIVPPQFTRWYCFLFFTPRLGGYFFINPICMGMWSRKIPGKKTWILPLLHHAPLLYPGAHWPGWFRPHETISWRFDFSGRSCGVSLQLLDRVEWKQKGRNHSETRKHAIYVHVLEARHPTYGWTMLNISRLFKATSEKTARVN